MFSGKSDPYCKVYIDNQTTDALKTSIVKSSLTPVWMEELFVDILADGCKLRVEVLDNDLTSDDFLGQCSLDVPAGREAVPEAEPAAEPEPEAEPDAEAEAEAEAEPEADPEPRDQQPCSQSRW
jgi:hypothetical protein